MIREGIKSKSLRFAPLKNSQNRTLHLTQQQLPTQVDGTSSVDCVSTNELLSQHTANVKCRNRGEKREEERKREMKNYVKC